MSRHGKAAKNQISNIKIENYKSKFKNEFKNNK